MCGSTRLGDRGIRCCVISHVLNELRARRKPNSCRLILAAVKLIWVEAGTHADSRRLIAMRGKLLASHAPSRPSRRAPLARCGMLVPENARHWCHHFAEPPGEVFQDARWAEFGRELGIDLRACLTVILFSRATLRRTCRRRRIWLAARGERIHAGAELRGRGVRELMLQKRDAPALFKALGKTSDIRRIAGRSRAAKSLASKRIALCPSRYDFHR